MEMIIIALKLIVGLSILNVWLVRSKKSTAYAHFELVKHITPVQNDLVDKIHFSNSRVFTCENGLFEIQSPG
ncbi:MAG: hypothetical protein GVY20_00090 [Bacteroidetes bacterium]|jgi:hypothetical protein|nr:hypothetical protein [Bacteroidota bacterium]